MKHLNRLFYMAERLKLNAKSLGLSYNCEVKLFGYSEAEARVEDGKTYHYPEMFDVNIENWSTWKGNFLPQTGVWIREGRDLSGPGLTTAQMYRRMLEMMREHAKRIALHAEAEASNCVVHGNTLVVVENLDAREWLGTRAIFKIYDNEGNCSRWYGASAESALENSQPWVKHPVMIALETEEG